KRYNKKRYNKKRYNKKRYNKKRYNKKRQPMASGAGETMFECRRRISICDVQARSSQQSTQDFLQITEQVDQHDLT
ncbi:hypothetical protein E4U52_001073, partial [Claviceps spartinae]